MNLKNSYLLKGGQVFLDNSFKQVDIFIKDGLIKDIDENLNEEGIVIDCTNKIVTPSFIDTHVHFRTPGFSYKEDLVTGSKAALHGGYSHVFEMPNTSPCLDDYETIEEHLKQIEKETLCYVYPFSAASTNLAGKELVAVDKIAKLNIVGFSDDGKGIQSDELMKEILIEAGKYNKVVSAHCEDEEEFAQGMGAVAIGSTSEKNNMLGINNKSEYAMIQRDINVIEEIDGKYNYQYHVCHISTKESLKIIENAKKQGYKVSCEVTPHHLISDESIIDVNNSNYKMNPPLRSKDDVNALIKGLNEGSIEVIATDHAPHSEEEKEQSIESAPFGIIGLELAFSLINTYLIKTGKVKLETVLNCLTSNPARLFNVDIGIVIGKDAHIDVIDLDKKVTYTKDNLKSKSSNTFYLNQELIGQVETVFFKDKVYQNKEEKK